MAAYHLFVRTPAICLVLAAATFIAFSPVLSNAFVNFDDTFYIVENQNVNHGLSAQGVKVAFTRTVGANWHPLTMISHMIDCQLFGLDARRHHLVSLCIHTLAGVLLFLVMQRMTAHVWPSAFVATVFLLHPLHVESVAWASERKDVLSALFWIAAMAFYTLYVQRGRSVRWYLLTLIALILGLLSKPMVVTLPAALLLLDFWPLKRFLDRDSFRPLIVEKIPFFVCSIAASVLAVVTQRDTGALPGFEQLPLRLRISNALSSYVEYLRQTFWPTKLAVFYPYPHEQPLTPVIACAGALLLISIAAIKLRGTRPYLFTGWFWYVGTLLPTIGIIQVGQQSHADRYMYLPMIGIAIVIAYGAADIPRRARWRPILWTSAIGTSTIFGVITWQVTHFWHSSIDLWEHAVKVTPESAVAYHNLGAALVEANRPDEAIAQFRRAIALNRAYASAYTNLAKALHMLGDEAGAEKVCRDALEVTPSDPAIWTQLGHVLSARGQLLAAAAAYARACQLAPANPQYKVNLASALAEQGKYDEAIRLYQLALDIDPDLREAQVGLARATQDRASGTSTAPTTSPARQDRARD